MEETAEFDLEVYLNNLEETDFLQELFNIYEV